MLHELSSLIVKPQSESDFMDSLNNSMGSMDLNSMYSDSNNKIPANHNGRMFIYGMGRIFAAKTAFIKNKEFFYDSKKSEFCENI